MGARAGDLFVLLQCWRLAPGLGSAVVFSLRALGDVARAYDDVVAPVVDETIADPAVRARACRALRAASMKFGLALLNFCRMSGGDQRAEVAALAGAITRLYDDLIEADAGVSLDERLGDLFAGRPFTACGDLDRLLAALFHQIAERTGTRPDDTAMVALRALHRYQSSSRRQREPDVKPSELAEISRGKGAMANLTLCALVQPELDEDEQELIMALGEVYQELDDYIDVEYDLRNGITTLVSLGTPRLADIGARMRILHRRLAAYYGRAAARRYCGGYSSFWRTTSRSADSRSLGGPPGGSPGGSRRTPFS